MNRTVESQANIDFTKIILLRNPGGLGVIAIGQEVQAVDVMIFAPVQQFGNFGLVQSHAVGTGDSSIEESGIPLQVGANVRFHGAAAGICLRERPRLTDHAAVPARCCILKQVTTDTMRACSCSVRSL